MWNMARKTQCEVGLRRSGVHTVPCKIMYMHIVFTDIYISIPSDPKPFTVTLGLGNINFVGDKQAVATTTARLSQPRQRMCSLPRSSLNPEL